MKKLLAAPLVVLALASLTASGTVRGQTQNTATPSATATATTAPVGPPPPPGAPPPQGQPTLSPPPPPCPPTGCPTATATPAPSPTPAPTETATPVAPQVTVKLAHKTVNPRSRQIVTVQTAPNANVYIEAKFPNGDTKGSYFTASSTGRARFAYTQPGSRITHSSRKARVRVDVSVGSQVSTTTKSYTIGFAALDVSAAPRRQARGKTVAIWVHTSANTRVSVTLRFRTGALAFGGGLQRTGRDGWASQRMVIPRSAPVGRVGVRGDARVNGRLVSGQSSFRIH